MAIVNDIVATSSNTVHDYAVYKLTNPENSSYVGCSYDLKRRLENYKTINKSCIRQRLLYESLKKHGYEAHRVEILDKFTSDSNRASGKEIFWIRSNMSNRNKWPEMNGLNLSDGGRGSRGMVLSEDRKRVIGDINRGQPMSEERKKFLSDYGKANPSRGMLGKKHTENCKERMSVAKKGKPSPHIGRKHTVEAILNNSKSKLGKPNIALKGRKLSPEIKAIMDAVRNTKRQPIILEKDGIETEYRSIIAAYKFLGIGKGLFTSIINGKMGGQYNGYFLKFKT